MLFCLSMIIFKKYTIILEANTEIKRWEKSMSKTKIQEKEWFTNNPFFGSKEAYDIFAEMMLESADAGELPKLLEHGEPESLTIQDIKILSQTFQQDTGLSIEFRMTTCNHCDRLHCLIIVDESEENEMESDEK